jgi:hypothetical protein
MNKFTLLASVGIIFGASGIATVSAMPARDSIEVYESWKVAHLPNEHEYWAYTELDTGYTLAYVASKDVVGPGCDMTSIAITSDVLKFPRSTSPLMITLNYGLNTDRTFNGMLVKRARQWASLYGVTTIPTNVLPELVRSSYIGSDKTFSVLLQQDNQTVSTGLGRTFGMRNAYQRAIDLCRLDVNRREYPPKMGIK